MSVAKDLYGLSRGTLGEGAVLTPEARLVLAALEKGVEPNLASICAETMLKSSVALRAMVELRRARRLRVIEPVGPR